MGGVVFACGGDGGTEEPADTTPDVGSTPVDTRLWLLDWPQPAQDDLLPELDVLYDKREGTIVGDTTGDQFTPFGGFSSVAAPQSELLAGGGAVISLDETLAAALQCGATFASGATVLCLPTASEGPRPGHYFAGVLTFEGAASARDASFDHAYEMYLQAEDDPALSVPPDRPFDALQKINRYFRIVSSGSAPWSLEANWFDDSQIKSMTDVADAQEFLPDVRAIIGEHAAVFIFPEGICAPGCRYNLGTFRQATGQTATQNNIAQDVLGADPTGPLQNPSNFTAFEAR
jgi:hypothetical protein